jgi:hypothetical protein
VTTKRNEHDSNLDCVFAGFGLQQPQWEDSFHSTADAGTLPISCTSSLCNGFKLVPDDYRRLAAGPVVKQQQASQLSQAINGHSGGCAPLCSSLVPIDLVLLTAGLIHNAVIQYFISVQRMCLTLSSPRYHSCN